MTDGVRNWLKELEMGEFADAFENNGVDLAHLEELTNDDLKDLGVDRLVDRKKILKAITSKFDETGSRQSRSTLAPERRQLTVMFCDLVGSTALSRQLDPEDLREVMRGYQDAVAGAVTRYGGHIGKYLGDGVLVYFGWPQAYEDQAERAVRAGLEAIKAVRAIVIRDRAHLDARIGISTGQVVVGDLVGESGLEEEAVSGETPNLAARLQGMAEPGQVIIGDATRMLVGRAFAMSDLGARELKGFDEPLRAWNVTGETDVESRFEAAHAAELTKLVGRDADFQLLSERWQQAKSGAGQVVLIAGEAGMGKSRLVQAMQQNIVDENRFYTHLQASPYHTNTPLFATIQNLRNAIGFENEDDLTKRLDRLEAFFSRGMEISTDTLAVFADLFGLEYKDRYGSVELAPQERKDLTLDTLIDRFLMLSRQRPFLFIIEDAHWGDPTAEEMIERLVPRIAKERVLLVITHRPEWQSTFNNLSHVETLQLTRLRMSQSSQIVRDIAGDGIPEDIVQRIVERTDGIPLFVEELTRSLVEGGFDRDDENIPATLQASLLARLDRLGPVAKEIAQIGATIGKEFSRQMLAAVTGKSEELLVGILDQLVNSGLVQRISSTPTVIYSFKHALVQDAAYQSLLRATRHDFHRRIALLLENQMQRGDQIQVELLAHHHTEAQQADLAVPYWLEAGRLAVSRSANQEAIAHLTKGRALLLLEAESAERDARELDICLTLGPALMSIKGLAAPEAEEIYLRAHQLSKSGKDSALSFQSAWGLWLVNQQSGRVDLAQSQTREVLSLAEQQLENVDYLLQAHHAAWTTELFIGNVATSQAHIAKGFALYDIAKHRHHAFTYGGHDPGVCAKTTAAETHCLLGYPDQAVQHAVEGLKLAEKLSHPFSLAMARYFMAQVHQYRQESDIVRSHAHATIKLCETHGFESFRAQAMVQLGWAIATVGQTEKGISSIQQGISALESSGTGMRRPYFLTLLADVLAKANQADAGLGVIEEAEATIKSSGEARWHAETQRVKGVLMEAAGIDPAKVEATYRYGMEIAVEQEAIWLQLRISNNLARFWYQSGREDEARELLTPVYGRFGEGFDTPDLVSAKTLLDEIR